MVFHLPATSASNVSQNDETPSGGGGQGEKATVLCDQVPADYIVTTSDCPAKIVDQARRMNIPLVSSLWIIQSLIHGKRLDPLSSPEFSFNYTKP